MGFSAIFFRSLFLAAPAVLLDAVLWALAGDSGEGTVAFLASNDFSEANLQRFKVSNVIKQCVKQTQFGKMSKKTGISGIDV
ncbi:MAG TPA: hypothetical protein VG842_04310 [Sediminibacterium sp.]|nr:hypothetical protein [Sediminibacterium sp.]